MHAHSLSRTRTLLFVPGNRPERFDKACEAGAGGIILDLEDAVGSADKDRARRTVLDWLTQRPNGSHVGVRINCVDTLTGLDDLAAFARTNARPDFYVLSKVQSAAEVQLYARHLCQPDHRTEFVCGIETGRGLDAASDIACASPAVAMLGFGGGDLATSLGNDGNWEAMLFARSRIVQAASAAGIRALDMPWIHLNDDEGLAAETRRVRSLGFKSKLAIHPRQVPGLEAALAPSEQERNAANHIVQAYRNAAGSASTVNGHLVDTANYQAALQLLGEYEHMAAAN